MGFGFNLFGLPVLVLATVGLLIYFFATQKKIALIILGVLWLLTVLVFILSPIADNYRKPIRLTKADIVGEYRVDTGFYPGKNAQWQYNHYKLYITDNDSIIFVVMKGEGVPDKFFRHKIIYSEGPPVLWKIHADTATHHVIRNQPALYRGHSKFYYVFQSGYYGNMYFRKVKN